MHTVVKNFKEVILLHLDDFPVPELVRMLRIFILMNQEKEFIEFLGKYFEVLDEPLKIINYLNLQASILGVGEYRVIKTYATWFIKHFKIDFKPYFVDIVEDHAQKDVMIQVLKEITRFFELKDKSLYA